LESERTEEAAEDYALLVVVVVVLSRFAVIKIVIIV
jgi:hypothetical protein